MPQILFLVVCESRGCWLALDEAPAGGLALGWGSVIGLTPDRRNDVRMSGKRQCPKMSLSRDPLLPTEKYESPSSDGGKWLK